MVSREEGGSPRIRVMDFGLAHASTENRLTKTGTLVGTVTYLSPEQVTSHAFDGRSDIYSLGTVLYECLTGEPPFTGEVQSVLYRIVHEIPQPPALGRARTSGKSCRTSSSSASRRIRQRRPQKAVPARRRAPAPPIDPPQRRVRESPDRQREPQPAEAFGLGVRRAREGVRRAPAAPERRGLRRLPVRGRGRRARNRKDAAPRGAEEARFDARRSASSTGGSSSRTGRSRTRASASSSRTTSAPATRAARRPSAPTSRTSRRTCSPSSRSLTEIPELRSAASGDSRRRVSHAAERKAEDRIQIFELLARTLTRIGGGQAARARPREPARRRRSRSRRSSTSCGGSARRPR